MMRTTILLTNLSPTSLSRSEINIINGCKISVIVHGDTRLIWPNTLERFILKRSENLLQSHLPAPPSHSLFSDHHLTPPLAVIVFRHRTPSTRIFFLQHSSLSSSSDPLSSISVPPPQTCGVLCFPTSLPPSHLPPPPSSPVHQPPQLIAGKWKHPLQ